ncbi:hypothetical protein [Paenibacillus sp. LHD-38]|uniref:hypothetical protein n=1 Tax=Paenibacillus sp. LHD-38 TaxID=3072143 RepID=UPI00280FA835|nr:hypothetical protein [Paenibacillus sp. LHD-38]MDQ8734250.1 hypothetical protein [Paenibacillus sp. LHD-38]
MLDAEKQYIDKLIENRKTIYNEELLLYLIQHKFPIAKQVFAKSKQELVINAIIEYLGQGMPFFDLIDEGNLGLNRGIDLLTKETKIKNLDEMLRKNIQETVEEAIAERRNHISNTIIPNKNQDI